MRLSAAQSRRRSFTLVLLLLVVGGCSHSSDRSDTATGPLQSPVSGPASRKVTSNGDTLLLSEGPRLSRIDTSGEEQLIQLEAGAYILDPVVGGDRIAFAIQPPASTTLDGRPDFGSDLYVAPRGGGQLRLLVKHSAPGEFVRGPAWLADGNHLVFDVRTVRDNGKVDLRLEVIDVTTGVRGRFFEGAISPVISPDGRTLACVWIESATGQQDIVLLDLTNRQARRLLGQNSTKLNISSLAWSPDGSRILFAATDPFVPGQAPRGSSPAATAHPTLSDLWIINADGSGPYTDKRPWRLPALGRSGRPHGTGIYVLALRGSWVRRRRDRPGHACSVMAH